MNCLEKILCGERTIIGVRDYGECVQPESNLWLNDLPGISLKIASRIANEEIVTGKALMEKCIKTAVKRVFDDFDQIISPYFDFNAIVDTRQIDDFRDCDILPVSSKDRGLIVKRWRSEMAQSYIEELYFKVSTTITTDVKIFDGELLVLTLKDVDFVAGIVKTVRVDRKFDKETQRIEMSNAMIEVYSTSVRESKNWTLQGCDCHSHDSQGLVIKGWDGMVEDNTMYGIGIKASVRCYNENALCSVLPKLHFSIWYCSGEEFMKEYIYSDRLNPVTTLTKDRARELRTEYANEYEEKYAATTKSIQAFLRSMKGECLTCNQNGYAQITP